MHINNNVARGMSINIGDTFTYGSTNDAGAIVAIDDNVMTIEWANDDVRNNVGFVTCNVNEFIETMCDVYL